MPHVVTPPPRPPTTEEPGSTADPAASPAPARGGAPGEPAPLLGRVLALLALLVAADLWLVHHVGEGVRNISALVLAAGVVGGVAKLLDRVFPAEVNALESRARDLVRKAAHPTALGVAALFALLVLITVSSVVVVPEDGTADPNVRIIPLDDPDAVRRPALDADTRLARAAFLPTTPFGRTVRVEADGYVSGLFEVYPITGLRLQLGTDLPPSPSLLIRPGVDALGALLDNAVLRVWRLTETGRDSIAAASGQATAFMVGRRRTIPAGHREEWQRELIRQGAPDPVAARIIAAWQDPVSLMPSAPLEPGTRLLIEVGYTPDEPVAAVEITLGDAPLADVPLFAPSP